MNKAVAVFNLRLLDLVDLQVCMLWCKSTLYAQHNSYKLLTKQRVPNTTHWVITQKKQFYSTSKKKS